MKIIVFAVMTLSAAAPLAAQGLVNFANTPSTSVYVQNTYPDSSYSIMHAAAGTYYFGLFLGQLNQSWSFTGLYATNTGVDGLFSGGVVAVPGWAAGTSANYFVAGWRGPHDFDARWLSFSGLPPIFGVSLNGLGISGDSSSTPVLNLFDGGSGTISSGFFQLQNNLVPEPSAAAIASVGAGLMLVHEIRKKRKQNCQSIR